MNEKRARLYLLIGAVNGFLAVALGAFAAHGLREILDATHLNTFETGVRYQMIHALALIGTGLLLRQPASRLLSLAGWAFLIGIILFSGSLYWLALGGPSWLGPVTPLGGLSFLLGWALLAIGSFQA
ncbi:DUF423 domain-containing protein [bacterium]|nr:DUF423 domain-containing protein [bacterium]